MLQFSSTLRAGAVVVFGGMVFLAAMLVRPGGAEEPPTVEPPETESGSLAPARDFVGKWRGVGQVRRGSNEGAWIERQEWVWKFTAPKEASNDAAAEPPRGTLVFKSSSAKYLQAGELSVGEGDGEIVLTAQSPAGAALRYVGASDGEGKLTFTAAEPAAESSSALPSGAPARISLKLTANGDRLVALYERKAPSGDGFVRLAEVGYTREGSGFGQGTNFVECIVTGGKGTIAVEHAGKKYYVCCGGCRDLFDQDPAGAVAEYHERKAQEKAKAKPKAN